MAVTWVHSSTGLKLPIAEMARAIQRLNASRAEKDRVILCVDGVHALGVEDFRLSEVGCDFLIAGTHKWMFGPRGTGLVWGHPRAWPLAQAIIPTFDSDAYDMWMRVIPPRPLPPAVSMTPGGFHSLNTGGRFRSSLPLSQALGKSRVTRPGFERSAQARTGGHAADYAPYPVSRSVSHGH